MRADSLRLNNWIASLLKELLLGYGKYFSKYGLLNSDGKRVLNEVARPILETNPQLKPLIRDLRREPTLENLRKLAGFFIDEGVVDELIREGVILSYSMRGKKRC